MHAKRGAHLIAVEVRRFGSLLHRHSELDDVEKELQQDQVIATEVPAKFVMDHLFERNNIALGTAAATLMLITVVIILAPWVYVRYVRSEGRHA